MSKRTVRILTAIVAMLAILIVSACSSVVQASGNPNSDWEPVTICHATGNGGYNEITPSTEGAYNGHANQHEDDIIPAPADGCPNGDDGGNDDGGNDDGGDDECQVDCDNGDDDECPIDADECPGEDDDDDTPIVIEIVQPADPAQGLWQVTIWPHTAQVDEGLVGFIWTVNGAPIFNDANGNGVYDAGEAYTVTEVEHRNRIVDATGEVVPNHAFSRLVTGYAWPDDLAPNPANYRAYTVFDGDSYDDVFSRPPVIGWYEVDDEFKQGDRFHFEG